MATSIISAETSTQGLNLFVPEISITIGTHLENLVENNEIESTPELLSVATSFTGSDSKPVRLTSVGRLDLDENPGFEASAWRLRNTSGEDIIGVSFGAFLNPSFTHNLSDGFDTFVLSSVATGSATHILEAGETRTTKAAANEDAEIFTPSIAETDSYIIIGSDFDDTLTGGDENDTLTGGEGSDIFVLELGPGADTITDFDANIDFFSVSELSFLDLIIEDNGDSTDISVGDDLLVTVEGVPSSIINDSSLFIGLEVPGIVLEGTNGADSLLGGDGGDTLIGFSGSDTLIGGLGNDSLSGGGGQDILEGDEGNDTLSGGGGNDTVEGGIGDDLLSGEGNADILNGGSGDDTLSGGSGSDTLEGGIGNDLLNGGGGQDLLDGGSGDDTLNGGGGQDLLDGGIDDDLLNGGNANDTLIGGLGNDTLTGAGGIDTFVLEAGGGSDIITDFNPDDELIGLLDDLTFADLTIQANGISATDTDIFNGAELLATVQGVDATTLDNAALFIDNFSL